MIVGEFSLSGTLDKSLGFGHFTSFLIEKDAFNQPYVRGLNHHFLRLKQASRKLEISCPSLEEIINRLRVVLATKDYISDNVELSRALPIRVKIIVWQDGWDVIEQSYNQQTTGAFKLIMIEGGRPLPELKSCSAIVSVLAQQFADKNGFNSALLMRGQEILEAAWGNIIWISKKAKKLVYRTEGVLAGVAQTLITQSYPYEVINCGFTIEDIFESAEAVFFCNAVRGVIPIVQINEWKAPQCNRHFATLTKILQESEITKI